MQRLPCSSRPSLVLFGLTLALLHGCAPVEEGEETPALVGTAQQGLGVPGFAELHHHMFAEEAFGVAAVPEPQPAL